jgi:cytosine/adenosine deaminase-related metal-dependent hydrolase
VTARWIIPVSSPPIPSGWIRIVDGLIVELGRGSPPVGSQDLGDVAILPRLINAHTHLEFSDLDCPVGEPGISLAGWIGCVLAARNSKTDSQRDQAIKQGMQELWLSGTVLAGEITTPPCRYPQYAGRPELVKFAEVVGLSQARSEERLNAARQHLLENPDGACSPHAPYSVTPLMVDRVVDLSRQSVRPLAMHVAESPDERELLCRGGGPLAETLKSLGVWQEGLFPWGDDPFVTLIDRLAMAPTGLLIHGNDLNGREIDRMAQYPNLSLVYCPRTHDFFRFKPHPIARLLASGVRVALGTDSRASNPDLSLWREAQFLLRHRVDLDPAIVLAMATLHGAAALGGRHLGAIEPGKQALLGSVRTTAVTAEQMYRDFSEQEYEPIEAGD